MPENFEFEDHANEPESENNDEKIKNINLAPICEMANRFASGSAVKPLIDSMSGKKHSQEQLNNEERFEILYKRYKDTLSQAGLELMLTWHRLYESDDRGIVRATFHLEDRDKFTHYLQLQDGSSMTFPQVAGITWVARDLTKHCLDGEYKLDNAEDERMLNFLGGLNGITTQYRRICTELKSREFEDEDYDMIEHPYYYMNSEELAESDELEKLVSGVGYLLRDVPDPEDATPEPIFEIHEAHKQLEELQHLSNAINGGYANEYIDIRHKNVPHPLNRHFLSLDYVYPKYLYDTNPEELQRGWQGVLETIDNLDKKQKNLPFIRELLGYAIKLLSDFIESIDKHSDKSFMESDITLKYYLKKEEEINEVIKRSMIIRPVYQKIRKMFSDRLAEIK